MQSKKRQYLKQYYEDGMTQTEKEKQYQRQYHKKHNKARNRRSKKYYYEHREEHRKWKNQYNKGRSEDFRMWRGIAGPCVKCGNGDSRVLDFHHLEPEKKKFNIGVKEWYYTPLIVLIEELAKCVIFCSNCHRIEEFENGVWQ